MSERAMRLIGLAVTDESIGEDPTLPQNLALVTIFGLRDEIRQEAKVAVQEAQAAGVRVIMITGDAKNTARAIAKEMGIIQGDNPVVTTSTELGEMSDAQVRDMNQLKQIQDNIQAKLQEKKKDRKVIPLWWKLGGVAALLALLFTLSLIHI